MEREYQKPDANVIIFDKNIKTLSEASPNSPEDHDTLEELFGSN